MKRIIILLIILLFPITIKAASIEEQTNALMETAEAYYRQGVQIQYDSYKKNLYRTPEDATSQHYNYTVCSGFTFSTYYYTFGIEIPYTTQTLLDYAYKNKDNTDLVIYYKGRTAADVYTDDVLGNNTSNVTNFVKELINIAKPGDVFVVSGHAMMIKEIGSDDIILIESAFESGKGRYDLTNHRDKYETLGTIKIASATTRLNTYYSYKDDSNKAITEIALIRFMNESQTFLDESDTSSNYSITPSAQSRVKYPKIDIEKIANITTNNITQQNNDYADLEDEIEYVITIKNNSTNPYTNIVVKENIDSKTTLLDATTGTVSNNQVTWNIDAIEPAQIITLKYKVKVNSEIDNLGKIITSTGTIDNIATSKIETYINTKFTTEQNQKILTAYNSLLQGSKTERDFINEIYLQALNINLGITNLSNNDIIKYDASVGTPSTTLQVKETKIINEEIKKYLYNNFYGLRIGNSSNESENIVRGILQWNPKINNELIDRARTLNETYLREGDIILTYTGATSTTDTNLVDKAYIYIDSQLVRKTSSGLEKLTGDELNTFLLDTVGENYLLLRPSVALEREDPNAEEPEVNPEEDPEDDPEEDPNSNNNESGNNNGNGHEDNPNTGAFIPTLTIGTLIATLFVIIIFNKPVIKKI